MRAAIGLQSQSGSDWRGGSRLLEMFSQSIPQSRSVRLTSLWGLFLPKFICISHVGSQHVSHLLPGFLLPGLCLHLLDLQGVCLPPPHEEVVVPNAQLKDLSQSRGKSRENELYTWGQGGGWCS